MGNDAVVRRLDLVIVLLLIVIAILLWPFPWEVLLVGVVLLFVSAAGAIIWGLAPADR